MFSKGKYYPSVWFQIKGQKLQTYIELSKAFKLHPTYSVKSIVFHYLYTVPLDMLLNIFADEMVIKNRSEVDGSRLRTNCSEYSGWN